MKWRQEEDEVGLGSSWIIGLELSSGLDVSVLILCLNIWVIFLVENAMRSWPSFVGGYPSIMDQTEHKKRMEWPKARNHI